MLGVGSLGFRVSGFGFSGLGYRISDFRVSGFEFRVCLGRHGVDVDVRILSTAHTPNVLIRFGSLVAFP